MSDPSLAEPLDQQFRTIFNKTNQKEEKIPALVIINTFNFIFNNFKINFKRIVYLK